MRVNIGYCWKLEYFFSFSLTCSWREPIVSSFFYLPVKTQLWKTGTVLFSSSFSSLYSSIFFQEENDDDKHAMKGEWTEKWTCDGIYHSPRTHKRWCFTEQSNLVMVDSMKYYYNNTCEANSYCSILFRIEPISCSYRLICTRDEAGCCA